MLFEQITIVGVGLIGGSVGLAAKARGVARRVVGTGRGQASLEKACVLGAIDHGTTDLREAVRETELVVICTPVDRVGRDVLAAAAHAPARAVVTDAGSTKAAIVAMVEDTLPAHSGPYFVGSHPLAGSEKSGAEYARVDLFEGRVTLVTPTARTAANALDLVESLWARLGSRVVRMSPADHDRALATTSHLPHAVAAGVASTTPVEWLQLTAGGFRDVTRIAGGDPQLWAAIFEANRDAVLASLSRFTDRIDAFRRLLETGDRDGLIRWLAEAKEVRDALGT